MGSPYKTLIGYGLKILFDSIIDNLKDVKNKGLQAPVSEMPLDPDHSLFYIFDNFPPPPVDLFTSYEKAVGKTKSTPSKSPLPSIFSSVTLDHSLPPRKFTCPKPFQVDLEHFVAYSETDAKKLLKQVGWNEFASEFSNLFAGLDPSDESGLFEGFSHLFRRWASGLPGICVGEEISLFEQWKTIAAMVFASGNEWEKGPADQFLLIGGDIPGIQDFVYTITNRGTTQGLRGRSFFIQLLGDAVVQRLLDENHLPSISVIYSVGGNFMILAPMGAMNLNQVYLEIETSILTFFEGELSICLASEEVHRTQLFTREFSDPISRKVKEKITAQKQRRFSQIAIQQWDTLFLPQGKPGNKHCAICQRMISEDDGSPITGIIQEGQSGLQCSACEGFVQLAIDLVKAESLSVSTVEPAKPSYWQKALFEVGKRWYSLLHQTPTPTPQTRVYLLNQLKFAGKAHGFRLLSKTTPHITASDLEDFKDRYEMLEGASDTNSIRSYPILAERSHGIKKLGILRMDVDNLGSIIARGLQNPNMMMISTLSCAMDQFFSGWLNNICEYINRYVGDTENGERLFVIYAGGDDLFVVGSWDIIPDIARKIREDFLVYSGDNPSLHISAGIALVGPKLPMYQAAEEAGEALERAKGYKGDTHEKNAICYLDEVVCWQDWIKVIEIGHLIETLMIYKLPESILQILQNIYIQYRGPKNKIYSPPQIEFGPWIWRATYALTRYRERIQKKDHKSDMQINDCIVDLQKAATTNPSVRYAAIAARWIELLRR